MFLLLLFELITSSRFTEINSRVLTKFEKFKSLITPKRAYHMHQYKSFLISTSASNGHKTSVEFWKKMVSAFNKKYVLESLPKDENKKWNLPSNQGNFTFILEDKSNVTSIRFEPVDGADCNIQKFHIYFAINNRIYSKSQPFVLERNAKRSQIFGFNSIMLIDSYVISADSNYGDSRTCLGDAYMYLNQ